MNRRIALIALAASAVLAPSIALAAGGGDGSFDGFRFFRHLLNLVIFVWVVGHFAKTPISDFLQFRRTEVKEGLDKAYDAKASAESRAADLQGRLDSLEAEVEEMMESVVTDGAREHTRLVAAGEDAARQIESATTRSIDEEARHAAAGLRRETIDLAMAQAGELLTRSVDESDRKRLTDGYLATLQETAQS